MTPEARWKALRKIVLDQIAKIDKDAAQDYSEGWLHALELVEAEMSRLSRQRPRKRGAK